MEDHRSILDRIEEKLDRVLSRRDDEWHEREWAPLDTPFAVYDYGDPAPRWFGGARADAPGWDPSIAGPRFDRIDVGSVGTHGVDPVSSYWGAQRSPISAHSSAREYYLLRRAMSDAGSGPYGEYRRRRMQDLDREYADFRREQQAKFDREFDNWREQRNAPPRPVDEPTREAATASES